MDVSGSESSDVDFLGPSDDESDTVTFTSREILARLERGWINEKISPELLPPLSAERDVMTKHVRMMENNLKKLDKMDVRTPIHSIELARIRFVLISYVRTRLLKIQEQAWFLMDSEQKRPVNVESVLMADELTFLRGFVSGVDDYLKTVVASNFPQPLQKVDTKKYMKAPHMDTFVFFRSKESQNVNVEDAEGQQYTVDLKDGDQHVMRYQPISSLVKSGAAYLV